MKKAGWIVFFVLIAGSTFGQGFAGQTPDGKFYFGGGGSFGAGSSGGYRYTYYSVFPLVGYRFTPQFSAGTIVNYQHYGYPDVGVTYVQYGVSPFLRYDFNQLFFTTEFDIISSPGYTTPTVNDPERQVYNRWLFGLGYSVPLTKSGRGAISAMAMYDVLYRQPSVFNSPVVFRVFFTI